MGFPAGEPMIFKPRHHAKQEVCGKFSKRHVCTYVCMYVCMYV